MRAMRSFRLRRQSRARSSPLGSGFVVLLERSGSWFAQPRLYLGRRLRTGQSWTSQIDLAHIFVLRGEQISMRLSATPCRSGGHHPVRLSLNPQLRVESRGATVTSDAGLLLPRELDKRLGLTDPRTGPNRQFPLPDLFRQSIYSRLAGYEDTDDAERLAEDPTFRMLASRERREARVALTSTLHWFETDVLAAERDYQALVRLNTALISTRRRDHRTGG